MKKLFVAFLAVIGLVACQEELVPEYQDNNAEIFATMETLDANKTSIDQYNNVLWSEGDQLVAFMKTTLGIRYQIKEQYVGTTAGGFSKVSNPDSGDDLEAGQEIDHNVVLYPYSDLVWCMKYDQNVPARSYKMNVVLPDTQRYVENSFANGAFPMIAVSSDNQLTFRNICGGVKLQFKGVDKIKSIKFEGLGGELVSGKASVVGYVEDNVPSITMASDASGSVTLDCGNGVQLSPDSPTTFIIAIPPVEFKSGMRITVTDTDGLSRSLTNANANTIRRSALLTFPVITYTQEGVFEIPEGTLTSYEIPSEGGRIEIPVTTNHEYEVVIPENAQGWIARTKTKALREEVISLDVLKNFTDETRSAEVLITTAGGETLNAITVLQEAGYYYDETQESVITYTTSNNKILTLPEDKFNSAILSHVYENGVGTITFAPGLTSISDAFKSRALMTSITLPHGIDKIEASAFNGCTRLSSITLGYRLKEIGDYAFSNCGSLTDISLPASITTVGNYAFNKCSSLSSMEIPNSVTSIGNYGFAQCSSLSSVSIPDSVTSIGNDAFDGCSSLMGISLPASITSIGNYTFNSCSSLSSIEIPNSVTSIGYRAFAFCSNLSSVTIPESVTTIHNDVFYRCPNLAEFKGKYASEDGNSLIKDNVLISFAPYEMTSYDIPDGVTEIAPYVFYGCSSLSNLTLPGALKVIGDYAFASCSSLTDIIIPASVTSVGDYAFHNCKKLSSVHSYPYIPPTLGGSEQYGSYAFDSQPSDRKIYVHPGAVNAYKTAYLWSEYANAIVAEAGDENPSEIVITYTTKDNIALTLDPACFNSEIISHTYENGLGQIKFAPGMNAIGERAFYNSTLTSINIPVGIVSIANRAFANCASLISISIPEGVLYLEDNVFNSSGLQSVTLPKSLVSIGANVFSWCKHLSDIVIPESVVKIGANAFEFCSALASVIIPHSVTTIGSSAFYGCTKLTSLKLGSGVQNIGECAFSKCVLLESVAIPESVTSIGTAAFIECNKLSEFSGKFASADGKALIIDNTIIAFAPGGMTSYSIPEGVTVVGERVFESNQLLESVVLPEGVTVIGYRSFTHSASLTSIHFPEGLAEIKSDAFYDCKKLASVDFPQSLTYIGDTSFEACMSLTTIRIPKKTEYVGFNSFGSCVNLSSVYCCPAIPPKGSYYMFNNTHKDLTIYVPKGTRDEYMAKDYWKDYNIVEGEGFVPDFIVDGVNKGEGILINDLYWAPINSASHISHYEAESICPDGWRLPTTNELLGLAANRSSFNSGYYFSGNKEYGTGPSVRLSALGRMQWGEDSDKERLQYYGEEGYYWSSESVGAYGAMCLKFSSSIVTSEGLNAFEYGASVRCVQSR